MHYKAGSLITGQGGSAPADGKKQLPLASSPHINLSRQQGAQTHWTLFDPSQVCAPRGTGDNGRRPEEDDRPFTPAAYLRIRSPGDGLNIAS